MHDRLTSFCVTCGLRQPPVSCCERCRGPLADLVHFESRRDALLAFRASYVEQEELRLARSAPSVRAAPVAFATGASAVLTASLGLPLVAFSPLAVAAVAAASATVGFGVGSALRAFSPRFLLGKDARARIQREVTQLAERALPIRPASPPPPSEGSITVAGRLVGTPTPSPFSEEPLLAARLVGEVQGRQIDDAWFAPGDIAFDGANVDRRQLARLAWIESAPIAPLSVGALSRSTRARLDAYLLERGIEVSNDTPLALLVVREGDSVRVRGRAAPRQVSDGYRGAVEVIDVADAVMI